MLIDTHCHLDFPDFEAERDDIIARAHASGVAQMVTISTRVRRLPELLKIAEKYPSVFCSVGTHPNNADEELDISADELVRLAESHDKIVAIGEAGLDYFYDTQKPEDQKTGLVRHIEAARRTKLACRSSGTEGWRYRSRLLHGARDGGVDGACKSGGDGR